MVVIIKSHKSSGTLPFIGTATVKDVTVGYTVVYQDFEDLLIVTHPHFPVPVLLNNDSGSLRTHSALAKVLGPFIERMPSTPSERSAHAFQGRSPVVMPVFC
jgi:hypothetical protein